MAPNVSARTAESARSRTPVRRQNGAKTVAAAASPRKVASTSPAPRKKHTDDASKKVAASKLAQPTPMKTLTPLERAAAALKPAGLVGRLPCREVEQDQISSHLRGALRQGGSEQVLYVAGMPGTGKTAAVLQAVRELQEAASAGAGAEPGFAFVHVNAMRLGAPSAVFSEILGRLPASSGRCAAAAAQGEVQRFFASRKPADPVVLLLIDEIDHLVTRSQSVLYTLFDMLSWRARLVVAAISNTMDLPERLLPRVASRFEIVRVDFWPYNRDQIQKILCERLRHHSASKVFASDSLKLCAARVAAGSGDVRKALQLCRLALELRQSEGLAASGQTGPAREEDVVVSTAHVNRAAQDLLYANPAATAVTRLSPRTRLVLVAVLLELRSRGSDVATLGAVVSRYQRMITILEKTDKNNKSLEPSSGSHAEDAAFIAYRLMAMSILAHQQQNQQARVAAKGSASQGSDGSLLLSLSGGLDAEDLKATLLRVEEDFAVRHLIQD